MPSPDFGERHHITRPAQGKSSEPTLGGPKGWLAEVPSIREHLKLFGSRLSKALLEETDALEQRLKKAKR